MYCSKEDAVSRDMFIRYADWFVDHQESDGSFPYKFEFPLRANLTLPEGFVSGMAQGMVLSVLIRAYYLTNQEKYLDAGYKTLQFDLKNADKNIQSGCRKTLKDFTHAYEELNKYDTLQLPEEYVSMPASYTLNGNLIGLIGLYDWSKGSPREYGSEEAERAFKEALSAIKVILPYYDYYGWTSYDLLQYTYGSTPHLGSSYAHEVCVKHLHVLYLLTNDEDILYWRNVFLNYEVDDFYRQTNSIYKPN